VKQKLKKNAKPLNGCCLRELFFGGETEKEIFDILPQATTSYPQLPKPTPLWICG